MTSNEDWKAELRSFRNSLAGTKVSRCVIKDLPPELFIVIFNFLRADERIRSFANLNRTSRGLYNVTLPILWKTIHWKWETTRSLRPEEADEWIRDATDWSLLRHARGAKHMQYLYGPLTFLNNSDEPVDYELAETYSRQSKACTTFHTYTTDITLKNPGTFEIFLGREYTFGTQDLTELIRGLHLPKGVKLDKEKGDRGLVRVLIPLWASYANTNQLRIHPQARAFPDRIASLIYDIRLKVFYDDGTEDRKLMGAMYEALSMLVPAAIVSERKAMSKTPTLRIGKLTLMQAKACLQVLVDAIETEPSCVKMKIHLEIPAEAADEDQLSIENLRSLFDPLIAYRASAQVVGPYQLEDMEVYVGVRRGTSFDGPYDDLVGILKRGTFKIFDFTTNVSNLMYTERIGIE